MILLLGTYGVRIKRTGYLNKVLFLFIKTNIISIHRSLSDDHSNIRKHQNNQSIGLFPALLELL